jgi:hypothetical protein
MTMKTKPGVYAPLLFIALVGASGLAVGATFDELDTNQDGQVSTDEAAKDVELKKAWSSVDQDANGAIDRAEFSAFETQREKPGASEQAPAEQQPADPMSQ